MNYRYNCGDEVIRVGVWDNDLHATVIVTDNKTKKAYIRSIHEDENGTFFTWNKNKIYLNDWIRTSMRELKERVNRKEWITSDDLCQAILSDGVDNVRFIIPLYTVSGGLGTSLKTKGTVCKIEERYNREVKNNYKLTVVPVDPDATVANRADYYTEDMASLIREGRIKII